MFGLFKTLVLACLSGILTGLVVIGGIGLWSAFPLAVGEILPGENLQALKQLPRSLMAAGVGGFAIGCLGAIASQFGGKRISIPISVLLVGFCALLTIRSTHPGINLSLESGWLDYLESYRLTLLATVGGTIGVTVIGWFLKPFVRNPDAS